MRKTVDQGDVEAFSVQERPQLLEAAALQQFTRVAGRQPEAQPEATVRRQALLECRGKAADVRINLLPPVAGVDVGAIRELKRAVATELHRLFPSADPRRSDVGDARRQLELG